MTYAETICAERDYAERYAENAMNLAVPSEAC
jgi:hypothetical protein